MVLTETHFPHNSRILSTPTTSSSTVPTHTHKGMVHKLVLIHTYDEYKLIETSKN